MLLLPNWTSQQTPVIAFTGLEISRTKLEIARTWLEISRTKIEVVLVELIVLSRRLIYNDITHNTYQ